VNLPATPFYMYLQGSGYLKKNEEVLDDNGCLLDQYLNTKNIPQVALGLLLFFTSALAFIFLAIFRMYRTKHVSKEQDSFKGEVEVAVAFAEVKAREASGDAKAKAAIAEAETRAKEAEEARVRAEKELAKLKAKMEQDKIERDRKEKDNEVVVQIGDQEGNAKPGTTSTEEIDLKGDAKSQNQKPGDTDPHEKQDTGSLEKTMEGSFGEEDEKLEPNHDEKETPKEAQIKDKGYHLEEPQCWEQEQSATSFEVVSRGEYEVIVTTNKSKDGASNEEDKNGNLIDNEEKGAKCCIPQDDKPSKEDPRFQEESEGAGLEKTGSLMKACTSVKSMDDKKDSPSKDDEQKHILHEEGESPNHDEEPGQEQQTDTKKQFPTDTKKQSPTHAGEQGLKNTKAEKPGTQVGEKLHMKELRICKGLKLISRRMGKESDSCGELNRTNCGGEKFEIKEGNLKIKSDELKQGTYKKTEIMIMDEKRGQIQNEKEALENLEAKHRDGSARQGIPSSPQHKNPFAVSMILIKDMGIQKPDEEISRVLSSVDGDVSKAVAVLLP